MQRQGLVKIVKVYPVLTGVAIGLLVGGSILVMGVWFPWVGEAFERHSGLMQAIYFTVYFFGAWTYLLWNWRRRSGFWQSLCILLVLHVTGVFLYSRSIEPLRMRHWSLLLFLESFVLVFFVNWSTRWFARSDKHGP